MESDDCSFAIHLTAEVDKFSQLEATEIAPMDLVKIKSEPLDSPPTPSSHGLLNLARQTLCPTESNSADDNNSHDLMKQYRSNIRNMLNPAAAAVVVANAMLGGSRYNPYSRMPLSYPRGTNNVSADIFQMKNNRGHYVCQQCKTVFGNRDALAMHMMDSVRNEVGGGGCNGMFRTNLNTADGQTSCTESLQSVPPLLTSPPRLLMGKTETGIIKSPFGINSSMIGRLGGVSRHQNIFPLHPKKALPSSTDATADVAQLLVCHICGESNLTFDTLSIHMLSHVKEHQLFQQEAAMEVNGANDMHCRVPLLAHEDGTAQIRPSKLSSTDYENEVQLSETEAQFCPKTANSLTDENEAKLDSNKTNQQSSSSESKMPPKCASEPPLLTSWHSIMAAHRSFEAQLVPSSNSPPDSSDYFWPSIFQRKLQCSPKNLFVNTKTSTTTVEQSSSQNKQVNDNQHISERTAVDNLVTLSEDGPLTAEPTSSSPPILSSNSDCPHLCPHCVIRFGDRTMFCLHMGLHSVSNPWQCNMCGQVLRNRNEFASHALHF